MTALGKLEPGTAKLNEAVKVYKAALKILTRKEMPQDWALAQGAKGGFGDALKELGEREKRTTYLDEAVAAWEACLTVAEAEWPQTQIDRLRSQISETRAAIAKRTAK